MLIFKKLKILSTIAPESVSVGKPLRKFFSKIVLHLLDFLPWHGLAVPEGLSPATMHSLPPSLARLSTLLPVNPSVSCADSSL